VLFRIAPIFTLVYACLDQLNSGLDYACIGCPKVAHDWADLRPEMILKLGQNNLLSWVESMLCDLSEFVVFMFYKLAIMWANSVLKRCMLIWLNQV